ncbi:hypothetical protein PR202_gb13160 [Eleusine coracana subsp. coracana]|uniref:DC1 domain-containing protein n=1 Tax=Eleusine coracana subsp. coracana TaxID=191504 RepID=A0AAV5EPT3_ELECO|nr:hypothetical protein PR202_gb13160 [Eleusine coracana subsp. coracana]
MIQHPSHPCTLHRYDCGTFTCDGCGGCGSGTRYRCHNCDCDFDLHVCRVRDIHLPLPWVCLDIPAVCASWGR